MDQGPPTTSELVLRRRRRPDRVREVLDDRVLRPAADGQRLADVALLVHEDEARLLALAVDDLELVVGARLGLDEARDDGVVLELSLADLEPRLDVGDLVVVGAAGPAVLDNVLVGHERFQRRAGAAAQRRGEARRDAVDGVGVREAERQRGRAGVMAAHRFSSARAGEARRDGKPRERLQASTTRTKPNACRTRPPTLHANGPGPDAKLKEPGQR